MARRRAAATESDPEKRGRGPGSWGHGGVNLNEKPEAALSAQMDESLSYHRPSPAQTERIEQLRNAQKAYAAQLEALCPASRALSIAKTEFETSCMWAVKAIVLEK